MPRNQNATNFHFLLLFGQQSKAAILAAGASAVAMSPERTCTVSWIGRYKEVELYMFIFGPSDLIIEVFGN